MDKKPYQSILENFKMNSIHPFFVKLIAMITIFSNLGALFLANYFFYLLFKIEFPTMYEKELFVMFFVSLFLLKLSLFLKIFNFEKHYKTLTGVKFVFTKPFRISFQDAYYDLKKIKKIIWIVNGIKNFIFNVIRNLFPVLFLWIFFLFYLIIKWFDDIGKVDTTFIGVLTLFGILISLIQFYFRDIESQKQSNYKLIINQVNKEVDSKINHLNLLDFIEDNEDNKKYSLIKEKIEGVRKRVINKRNEGEILIGSFRKVKYDIINSFPDPKVFFYLLEEKILGEIKDKERTKLITKLNELYEDFFENVSNEVIEHFKEDNNINSELSMNYLLKSISDVNTDILSHYFSSEKDEIDTNKELIKYGDRKETLYFEILMSIMLSSLVKKENN